MNLKTARVWLSYIGVTILLFVNTWVLNTSFERVSSQERWVKKTSDTLTLVELIVSSMKDAETGVRGFLLTRRDSYLEHYNEAQLAAPIRLATLQRLTEGDQQSLDLLSIFNELIADEFSALSKAAKKDIRLNKQEVDKHLAEGKAVMDLIRNQAEEIKRIHRQKLSRYSERAEESRSIFFWSLFGTSGLSWLLLSFAVYQIHRNISRALNESQKNEIQAWSGLHLSELSKISSGEISSKEVASQVLNYLSLHTPLAAARLYQFEGSGIEELGSFGIPESAIKPNHGGLIKEARKKNTLWIIKDLPDDFWAISSGLGSAKPRVLVFMPLIFQSRTIALLEMASFEDLNDQYIQLFQGMKDILATNLSAAQSREDLQELLKKSQTLAEELQSQRALMEQQVKELEKLRVAAEAANVAKSIFLANMSHEIRTPLASVMGFADLIARGEVPPHELDACASSIRRNGNLLLRLIDDILDLSKIEANRIEMERADSSIIEVLEDIDSTLSFKAREKGISLRFNTPENYDKNHVFDQIRLKQILLNVIGNAIKFTARGEVVVSTEITPSSAASDTVRITVKDQGVGIALESMERLFHPFGQADPTVKREFGGSGLGLVISRRLAKAMGGDVRIISSVIGQGSVFEIVVILDRSDKKSIAKSLRKKSAQEARPIEVNLSDKRILAVDDARDNLILIEMFLRNTKAEIIFASNGLEAIDAYKKHSFDLVLMDIQMPKMDGLEATAEIRKLNSNIPIIALTAHASQAEYDSCLKVGCNDVLLKPVSKNHLIEVVQKSLIST